jgi:hypothetical protein
VHRLLVTAHVPSSPILVTLLMEALRSSETSILIRATWNNIPEDGILHSHHLENFKSYMVTGFIHFNYNHDKLRSLGIDSTGSSFGSASSTAFA